MAATARDAQTRALLSFSVGGREYELKQPQTVLEARSQYDEAQYAVSAAEKVQQEARQALEEATASLDAAMAFRHHARQLHQRIVVDPRDPTHYEAPMDLQTLLEVRKRDQCPAPVGS